MGLSSAFCSSCVITILFAFSLLCRGFNFSLQLAHNYCFFEKTATFPQMLPKWVIVTLSLHDCLTWVLTGKVKFYFTACLCLHPFNVSFLVTISVLLLQPLTISFNWFAVAALQNAPSPAFVSSRTAFSSSHHPNEVKTPGFCFIVHDACFKSGLEGTSTQKKINSAPVFEKVHWESPHTRTNVCQRWMTLSFCITWLANAVQTHFSNCSSFHCTLDELTLSSENAEDLVSNLFNFQLLKAPVSVADQHFVRHLLVVQHTDSTITHHSANTSFTQCKSFLSWVHHTLFCFKCAATAHFWMSHEISLPSLCQCSLFLFFAVTHNFQCIQKVISGLCSHNISMCASASCRLPMCHHHICMANHGLVGRAVWTQHSAELHC